MNLNKIQLIGNLVGDPVAKKLPSGRSVAQFRLVTKTNSTGPRADLVLDKTEYHQIVTFGRLADVAAKYLKKGDRAYLDGQLTTREWRDESGTKRSRTEIVTQNLIMLGGGRRSGREKRNDDVVTGENGGD